MTRGEILAMSSTQLREAIAEALGYQKQCGFYDAACINPQDYWTTPERGVTSVLPDWTEKITAAIMLIDAGYLDYIYDISSTLDPVYDRYRVRIFPVEDQPACIAWGETMALAICRAWLMYKSEVTK